jgi:hypothetical protein
MLLNPQPSLLQGRASNEYGDLIFFGKPHRTFGMVKVLMRNENCLNLSHRKVQSLHAKFRFPTGNSGINEHSLMLITYIIAVTVASRVY